MLVEMSEVSPTDTRSFSINQTAQVTLPQPLPVQGTNVSHYSRPVLVTSLPGSVSPGNTLLRVQQPLSQQPLIIEKLILKATYRNRKEFKLFILRKPLGSY